MMSMQAAAETVWGSAQEHLRSMLSQDTYNLWFAPLKAGAIDDSGITLEVANEFCEVWLKDNYMGLLQDVVALASGKQYNVRFKVASIHPAPAPLPSTPAALPPRPR